MDRRLRAALLWTPRILGVLCVLFLALFALDVFEMEASFWEIAGGFVMHLVPAAVVLIVLVLGWFWPWLGGLLFLALGAAYVLTNRPHPLLWDVTIAGPLAVTGVLFLAAWWVYRRAGLQP